MQTASFEITIDGEIHPDFAAAFAPACVTCRDGRTIVSAQSIDQAALHGILGLVASSGLTLLGVVQVPSESDDPPNPAAREPTQW
jgi:hypothetical protein